MDLTYVRAQFPALDGDWTFLDNAGGAQILRPVVDRIHDYLTSCNVQLGASYEVSRQATERVDSARGAMAAFINAADSSEVVMGPSTSMLLRILAHRLSDTLEQGDEVIVTNCDHEANIGPWVELERKGMRIRTWRLDPETLTLNTDDLTKLITRRTRLVALTHTSNILGEINPIKKIARIVHDAGSLICVDGVAYAPHRPIDVQDLGVDFYAMSFYKVYGPHYALLYGRRDHLLRMPAFNHFFIEEDEIPYKFQPGNVNYELSTGMVGLWDYIDGFAGAHGRSDLSRREQKQFFFDTIAAHETTIGSRLLDYLSTKKSVRVIGPPRMGDASTRVPTVSFVVDDTQSDVITAEVDKHKIGIRYGDFYARRLIDDLNLGSQNGVVRVSMVHYNSLDEIDQLIGVFDRLF